MKTNIGKPLMRNELKKINGGIIPLISLCLWCNALNMAYCCSIQAACCKNG
ncbi:hypothetical protein [Chitinophaga nivalis]|uniref:Bacteriocin n=1 Tax=Chitinophaga nivalis TaxID=2991709 RepID=A0ABT3IWE3_9BACT|nr:hypothetical protein [Chitinophaga nivalis]MCW3462009.1 hypothetical protein [Chitinophaga nivalis]MCW3488299.1 hypothetical protein [Chitinophaga nivalis]